MHQSLQKLRKDLERSRQDFEKAKEALLTSESHRETEKKRYESMSISFKNTEKQANAKLSEQDRQLKALRKANETLRDSAMFEKSNRNKDASQLRATVSQQAKWINEKKAVERDRLESHAKLFQDHRKSKDDASHLRRELKIAMKRSDMAELNVKSLTADVKMRDDTIKGLEKQAKDGMEAQAAAAGLRRTVQRLELELKAERAGSTLGPFEKHLEPLKMTIRQVSEENATLRIHNSQLSVSIQKLLEERADLEDKHTDALEKAKSNVVVVTGGDDRPMSGDGDDAASSEKPSAHVPLEKYDAKCREVADLNLRLKAIEEEMEKPLGDFSDEDSEISDSELALDRIAGLPGVDLPKGGRAGANDGPPSVLVAFKTKYPVVRAASARLGGGRGGARKQISRSTSNKRARPQSDASDNKGTTSSKKATPSSASNSKLISIDSDTPPQDEDEDDKEADGSEMSLARRRKRRRTTVDKKPFVEESSSEDERSYSEDEDEDDDGADMEDEDADDKDQSDLDRESDDHCTVCSFDRGQLLICDRCPKVFHLGCVGLEAVPDGNWLCPYCDKNRKVYTHQCAKCPVSFAFALLLKRHKMLHASSKGGQLTLKGATKTCPMCDMRVANATLTCPRCRTRFVTPHDGKPRNSGAGTPRRKITLSPPPAKKKRLAPSSEKTPGSTAPAVAPAPSSSASSGEKPVPSKASDGAATATTNSDNATSKNNDTDSVTSDKMEIDTKEAPSEVPKSDPKIDMSNGQKPAEDASKLSNGVSTHIDQESTSINSASASSLSESSSAKSSADSPSASPTKSSGATVQANGAGTNGSEAPKAHDSTNLSNGTSEKTTAPSSPVSEQRSESSAVPSEKRAPSSTPSVTVNGSRS